MALPGDCGCMKMLRLLRIRIYLWQCFGGVRFICVGKIRTIDRARDWHYVSCNSCSKKVNDNNGIYECNDHEPQINVNYRYTFGASIIDETGSAIFIFFSTHAENLSGITYATMIQIQRLNATEGILAKLL